MRAPKEGLNFIFRVSEKSVLLTAGPGIALDFNTVNSCPPAHRNLVQKNGLVAKVWLSVSDKGLNANQIRDLFEKGTDSVRIWKSALAQCNLIGEDKPFSPDQATQIPWPILSESEFNERVKFIQARQLCESVEGSNYCVPICDVQTFTKKVDSLSVNVAVIWMPLFNNDIVSWSEKYISEKKSVPQIYLTRFVSHASAALNALHKIVMSVNSNQIYGCPQTFDIDDVFVSERDGEPEFVISTSMMKNKAKLAAINGFKNNNYTTLGYYPYLSPEQVLNNNAPIRRPTYDVWSIGMILYNIATGVPSLRAQVKKANLSKSNVLPFNHPDVPIHDITNTIRTEVSRAGYKPELVTLIGLLLSPDYHCRPSLPVLGKMMIELDRSSPILRFPFTLGSFDLIPLKDPSEIELNASARKYVTKDLCILCNQNRNLVKCACGQGSHTPGMASPTWSGDELLPGFIRPVAAMSFLYPLVPRLDEKERRRLTSTGLGAETESASRGFRASGFHNLEDSMDIGQLFQLFGGFAFFSASEHADKRVAVQDALTLLPSKALRRNERSLSVGSVEFAGALPWYSECTKTLQKQGALSCSVPFNFIGTADKVNWFGWIAPGETFKLSSGKNWTPAPDGAFVFIFNEDLSPSEYDRFFPVTSIKSVTNKFALDSTSLIDKVFKRHVEAGTENFNSKSGGLSVQSGRASRSGLMFDDSLSQHNETSPQRSRRRSRANMNTSAVDIPSSLGEIVETDEKIAPPRRQTVTEGTSKNSPRSSKKTKQVPRERKSTSLVIGMIPDNEAQQLSRGERPQSNKEQPRAINPQTSSKVTPTNGSKRPSNTIPNRKSQPNSVPPPRDLDTAAFQPMSLSQTDDVVHSSPAGPAYVNSTPKVPSRLPAIEAKLKTPVVHLYGKWFPGNIIEAVFQSLTFWIAQSGEHGTMQEAYRINQATRAALRAPANAVYMAFISNQVPLFLRNHSSCNFSITSLIIPHHGFVFYDDKENIMGVLSLRMSADVNVAQMSKNSFRIPLQSLSPVRCNPTDTMNFYASYISDEILTVQNHLQDKDRSMSFVSSDLFHTRSILDNSNVPNNALNSTKRMSENPANNSISSSRKGSSNESVMCWIGFDFPKGTLVCSDAYQEIWFPFAFN